MWAHCTLWGELFVIFFMLHVYCILYTVYIHTWPDTLPFHPNNNTEWTHRNDVPTAFLASCFQPPCWCTDNRMYIPPAPPRKQTHVSFNNTIFGYINLIFAVILHNHTSFQCKWSELISWFFVWQYEPTQCSRVTLEKLTVP